MVDYKKLTKLQLDIFKEAASIGASYAATALSQIVRQTIMIKVPRFSIVEVKRFPETFGEAKRVVCISLRVLGDVMGGILLILTWDRSLALANMIRGEGSGTTKVLNDLDQSALKECGSIVTASYLRAMGQFMDISLVHSVPRLAVGNLGDVMKDVFKELSRRAKIAFCIDTEFAELNNKITGHFVLIPEAEGLEVMLSRLTKGEAARRLP